MHVLCSTGEVVPNVNKKFAHQQETISAYNLSDHTLPMNNEIINEVDSEVANNDSKKSQTADDGKMATNSDSSSSSSSSSSNNSTLIAEDSTEAAQVQPMESPMVSNINTQPQLIVTSNKEHVQDDGLVSVSDQSTLSQSCDEMSETITHSITQPQMIGELLLILQLD